MGTPLIAGWVAHIAFWTLLIVAAISGELQKRSLAVFAILWLLARFGLPYLPNGESFFTPIVAIFDVVLVFIVLKADVPLT